MTLKGVAARLEQLPRVVIDDALEAFADIVRAEVTKAIGSDTMRLHVRGGRRVPVRIEVTGTVRGSGASVDAFVNGKPAGIWVWLEDGTKAHLEGKGRTLAAPSYDHPVKGPIRHPGSTGKRVWSKAVAEFRTQFPDIAIADLRKAVGDG